MESQKTIILHSVYKPFRVLLSVIDSCLWNWTQIVSVIGWLFPPSQLHVYPYTFFRQDKLWVKYFLDGLVSSSLPCHKAITSGSISPMPRSHHLLPSVFLLTLSDCSPKLYLHLTHNFPSPSPLPLSCILKPNSNDYFISSSE